jgi:hypothetical protein
VKQEAGNGVVMLCSKDGGDIEVFGENSIPNTSTGFARDIRSLLRQHGFAS